MCVQERGQHRQDAEDDVDDVRMILRWFKDELMMMMLGLVGNKFGFSCSESDVFRSF